MKLLTVVLVAVICVVSLINYSCTTARDIIDESAYIASAMAGEPVPVCGTLETTKGVPILRLWGSHFRMGYAYGYLYAQRMIELTDYWFQSLYTNNSETYTQMTDRMHRYVLWSDGAKEEAQGCFYGIKAALGYTPVISNNFTGNQPIQINIEMLLLNNCFFLLHNVEQGCSGFAAWGEATGDGQTRIGGNLEGPDKSLTSTAVLVVRKPSYGLSTAYLGVISIFLGGSAGVTKGMNETGLAIVSQGAHGYSPSWTTISEKGYAAVMIRDILENISSGPNMVCDIIKEFQEKPSIISGIYVFAQKSIPDVTLQPDQMAVVIEKDCDGFNVRLPSHNPLANTSLKDVIIGTAHYILRTAHMSTQYNYDIYNTSVSRYNDMLNVLSTTTISSVTDMQKVLQAAGHGGALDSVYMEPDTLTLSIGYGTPDSLESCYLTPVTFTWEELFATIP